MSWLFLLLARLPFFIGHIGNKIYFPKPLKKEEEKMYVQLFFEGDKDARDKLIEHNMRLVAHIAKKYSGQKRDSDDLISIGSIGLIKAVNSYSPDKNTHLATYAARCIENEILMFLRSTKRQKNEISLQEPLGTDKEGNEVSLIDILSSNEPDVSEKLETKMCTDSVLKKMRSMLDAREIQIISLRYGLGGKEPLKQREVAQKLNISRSYVSRIEKSAMEKLKKIKE